MRGCCKILCQKTLQYRGELDIPILVPLRTVLAVLLAIPVLCTVTPGAKISTAVPKLENEARVSVALSIAPTVMADGAEAGELFNASCYFLSASSLYMS